ncbi:MAG: DegT/DnrJ/EryC1/StrS family aminotransferase [Candidatus Muirbacterium halophilum]|nr:DegT/DnrJ/EryC1/StrS family aminotransferase [Candidatus Muirbacterium halophilum]MCK9474604.1 DegT/DnrJ/EryC1/StrS family aminotransferase [Candidatus Muirbacterium halophilum]
MKIPLLDLKVQYLSIKNEVDSAIQGVLNNTSFIMGEEVNKFEESLKSYIRSEYAVSCASGSDALLLALMAIDVKEGDEVITTPYTFFATAGAISRLGAKPVFVDIDEDDCNIDVSKIEKAVTENTKAIIPVHLYGKCADMEKISEIASRYDLKVIEDACQSIGANFRFEDGTVKQAGTIGDIGCFSFFPSKNLGAYGDGGAVVTNNKDLAEKIKILRVHGSSPKYYHKYIGINSRLDAIQAAILNVKIKYLDEWTMRRIEKAKIYSNMIKEKVMENRISYYPFFEYGKQHIYHQFVIQIENRDEVIKRLNDNGIGTAVYYPVPLHIQECFKDLGYKKGDMSVSERKAETTLALPIYPELKKIFIEKIIDIIGCKS